MEKALLAYLRHLAFWKAIEKIGLSPANPNVWEVESGLIHDFKMKFKCAKEADIN